jgi:hypothetical protein
MHELEDLHIDGTRVTDVAPLAGLRALAVIYMQGTKVADIASLARVKTLRFVQLSDTAVPEAQRTGARARKIEVRDRGCVVLRYRMTLLSPPIPPRPA